MITVLPSVAGGIGTAISGAASLGASIYGAERSAQAQEKANETNLQIARETNQANLDLYREQYYNNVAQWQREYEANSPQSKVAQLRAAGLNPSLAYGQTGNQGSASLPSASPAVTGAPMQPEYGANYSDMLRSGFSTALNDMLSLVEGQQRVESMKYDNQLKQATLNDKITESMLNIARSRQSLRYDKKLYNYLGEQLADIRNKNRLFNETYSSQVDAYQLQNDVMRKTMQEADSVIALHNAQRDTAVLSLRLDVERNSREWKSLNGSLEFINEQINKLKQEGRLTEQNIRNAVQTGLSIKLQNGKSAQELIHNKDLLPLVLQQTKSNIRNTDVQTVGAISNMIAKPMNAVTKGLSLMFGKYQ